MSLNETPPCFSRTSTLEKPSCGPGVLTLEAALEARGWWKHRRPTLSAGADSEGGAAQGSAFSVSAQVQPTSCPRSDLGWAQCQTWLHVGHPGALGPSSTRPSSESDQSEMQPEPRPKAHRCKPLAKAGGPRRQLHSVHVAREHTRHVLLWPRTPQMSVHGKRKSLEPPGTGLAIRRARKLYSAIMAVFRENELHSRGDAVFCTRSERKR